MKAAIFAAILLFVSGIAFSATIVVPDHYTTIQGAINASTNGDTIIVRPGTYVENIDFQGKAIHLKSVQGAEVTIIDGNHAGSVVKFRNQEGADSVLEGFKVKNGESSGSGISGSGGGIHCYFSSPTITNNIIKKNKAFNRGGGIYCEGSSPTIIDNTIEKNSAENGGGGISCYNNSSPNIIDNTITRNTTQEDGAGIYCENASPAIIDNVITNNSTSSNYSTLGGGICCSGSSPTIMDNAIANNSAYDGAGIGSTGSFSTITDNRITNNKAIYGGGISCSHSSPTITNNTIAENVASDGGGIYGIRSSPAITNNDIELNIARRSGGGIYCSYDSTPAITNNNIEKNKAFSNGGGISCNSASAIIKHNAIIGNKTPGKGGGIRCYKYSPAITNNTIAMNKAALGGGIHCSLSSPLIASNIITGNTADHGGGGIYCLESSEIVVNNAIWGNAADRNGGGIRCKDSASTIANNTIAMNAAGYNGGGIHISSGSLEVLNSILCNNSAPTAPEISVHSGGSLVVRFSNITGGWPGLGNIGTDPLFVDPAGNDYHLTWNSPCRNAGFNHPALPNEDFEGDPRIRLGRVDIGADEFSHHLYQVGDTMPGSQISVRVIGPPGAWAILGSGAGIQDPPYQSPYGPIHIARPWTTYNLGLIPSDGVLSVPVTLPGAWVPGDEHYFQALVSNSIAMATNLMVVEVE